MKNRSLKRILFGSQLGLFVAFNFCLLLTIYQLIAEPNNAPDTSNSKTLGNAGEVFDPSLFRLNSVTKLLNYCDSLYANTAAIKQGIQFENMYPELVNGVVSRRFYHGYSHYDFKDNFVGVLLSKMSISGLSAIVTPDDILGHANAACSQQSIVMMELLRKKGFATRKVGFKGKKYGHFSFEVFYNGSWHFFDPNMEPDMAVLKAYNNPGIDFLSKNPHILLAAYSKYPVEKVMDIYPNYFYGSVNKFPAPAAMVFQKVTKIFSYTIWLFFLIAFILVRQKYKKLSTIAIRQKEEGRMTQIENEMPLAFYPKYSA